MKNKILFLALFFLVPFSARASVAFSEIMYDPQGTDSKHEWIEIQNTGTASIDLSKYKFNDGTSATNHALNAPPLNGGKGSMQLAAGAYAIIADDAATFAADFPAFSGTVIDSSFSLLNSQGTLQFMDCSSDTCVPSVTIAYASGMGGSNDGSSLQRNEAGSLSAAPPTPGAAFVPGSSLPAVTAGSDQAASGTTPTPADTGTTTVSDTNSTTATSTATGTNSATTTVTTTGGSSVSTTVQKPVVSTMKASLTVPKSAQVGVPSQMSVSVTGTAGERVTTGMFRVAFGDGTEHVGTPLSFDHIYSYPGTYVVQFIYKASEYGDTSPEVKVRMNIDVVQTSVTTKVNKDGSVTLGNAGTKEADLSNWKVESLSVMSDAPFVIPNGTVLLAGKTLTLPISMTHIPLAHTSIMALALPTGVVSSFDISQYANGTAPSTVKGRTEQVPLVAVEDGVAKETFQRMETDAQAEFSAAAVDAFEDPGVPESCGMLLACISGMLALLGISVYMLRRVVLRTQSEELP